MKIHIVVTYLPRTELYFRKIGVNGFFRKNRGNRRPKAEVISCFPASSTLPTVGEGLFQNEVKELGWGLKLH
jgi:hypothetical protein